jgi:hypothetical protein
MVPNKKNWVDGFVILDGQSVDGENMIGNLEIFYCDADDPPETVYREGEISEQLVESL